MTNQEREEHIRKILRKVAMSHFNIKPPIEPYSWKAYVDFAQGIDYSACYQHGKDFDWEILDDLNSEHTFSKGKDLIELNDFEPLPFYHTKELKTDLETYQKIQAYKFQEAILNATDI